MTGEYIDSHAHFDKFAAKGLVEEVLARAADAGVTRIIAVGGNAESNRLVASLAARHPETLHVAVGFDRDQAERPNDLQALTEQLALPSVVAVGEIGLDYHYHPETAAIQKRLLREQLDIAAALGLPVIIHSREADEDTLELLRAYVGNWPRPDRSPGVLHCFTGTPAFAGQVLELGFMVSFSGILTFNQAGQVREAARMIPLERLMIETDCPYLAPVPHRGKQNEPAWVVCVAEKLAELHGCPVQKIAGITTRNALDFFGIRAINESEQKTIVADDAFRKGTGHDN